MIFHKGMVKRCRKEGTSWMTKDHPSQIWFSAKWALDWEVFWQIFSSLFSIKKKQNITDCYQGHFCLAKILKLGLRASEQKEIRGVSLSPLSLNICLMLGVYMVLICQTDEVCSFLFKETSCFCNTNILFLPTRGDRFNSKLGVCIQFPKQTTIATH